MGKEFKLDLNNRGQPFNTEFQAGIHLLSADLNV